jgi:hypothetical protein
MRVKGVLHQPETKPMLKQEARDAILLTIAKARASIDNVASGRVQSFAEIAQCEGKVERHIGLLAPLAFIPPRTLAAIIDGTGPHDATVTALAQAVPYRWDRSPHDQGRSNDPTTAVEDWLGFHNRLLASLSPTSPTTQSRATPVSRRSQNRL